jgi:FkbM family methyltransferase
MEFIDMKEKKINTNLIEVTEQQLVDIHIQPDDIVLELGARYGTVSCRINKKLNNKLNQVSVEPDERVWSALEINKKNNNCNFHILKGFCSDKKLSLTNINDYIDGYAATFVEDNKSNILSYTLHEIEEKYNLKFNVLVADCEGFLGEFFYQNPNFYDQLRMIIFEADYPEKCDYDSIRETLHQKGFECKLIGHQNVFIKKI